MCRLPKHKLSGHNYRSGTLVKHCYQAPAWRQAWKYRVRANAPQQCAHRAKLRHIRPAVDPKLTAFDLLDCHALEIPGMVHGEIADRSTFSGSDLPIVCLVIRLGNILPSMNPARPP